MLYAAETDEAIFDEAVRCVDKLYDTVSAVAKFNDVIESATAPADLKVKSFFWLAHIYLFEGDEDRAEETFKRMFKLVPEPGYDFTASLSEAITANSRLTSLYERQKSLTEREIRSSESADKREKTEKPKKSGTIKLGNVIVSSLLVALYIGFLTII